MKKIKFVLFLIMLLIIPSAFSELNLTIDQMFYNCVYAENMSNCSIDQFEAIIDYVSNESDTYEKYYHSTLDAYYGSIGAGSGGGRIEQVAIEVPSLFEELSVFAMSFFKFVLLLFFVATWVSVFLASMKYLLSDKK